jgi:hypothetical protein
MDVRVKLVGALEAPRYFRADFSGPLAHFPSVANTHQPIKLPSGKLSIIHKREVKQKLEGARDQLLVACRVQLGGVPLFGSSKVVALWYLAANNRRDAANLLKGAVDFCLEQSGIVRNDKQVLPFAFPSEWAGAPFKDRTVLVVRPWQEAAIHGGVRQFLQTLISEPTLSPPIRQCESVTC